MCSLSMERGERWTVEKKTDWQTDADNQNNMGDDVRWYAGDRHAHIYKVGLNNNYE